jgi:hypothetical protein
MRFVLSKSNSCVKNRTFRDHGLVDASPGFQAGWSDLFVSVAYLEFLIKFCTFEGTVPYRSSDQIFCREEFGVSFVALGPLEPQTARH